MARAWLSTAPTLLLLGLVLFHGTAEKTHARFLQLGESVWPGYAGLRVEPEPPECDPEGPAPAAESEAAGGDDDEFLDDLLGEDRGGPAEGGEAESDPGRVAPKPDEDDAFLDDLLSDEDGEEGESPTDEDAGDVLPEQEAPSREAVQAARARCEQEHAKYAEHIARYTTGLRAFLGFEGTIAAFVHLGVSYLRHILVLLLLVGAATATAGRGHIALRPPSTQKDDRTSEIGQLVANLFLLVSSVFKWRVDQTSGIEIQNEWIPILWIVGFVVLIGLNVRNLLRPAAGLTEGGRSATGLLSVPLYAGMAMVSGLYFFIAELHPAGLAIYLQKLTEHSLLYIHVGLYVWAGMLLKQTRLAALIFDVLRPWKLPPELLAFIVVAGSAIPTAYSGASGIFVIAAGAVIYGELRRAGARDQLARAATAMSGSLGVVLSPCLLVVIVASLNKQVTTDQLYGWGWRVYALTTVLFLIASLAVRQGPLAIAPAAEALRGTRAALRPLIPYVLIFVAVLAVYGFGLNTGLDEHTAPVILPVLLVLLLVFDRWPGRAEAASEPGGPGTAIYHGTTETTQHIGALLLLMALSVCLGGVIERGELMNALPTAFGSPATAMVLLVGILVIIGMIMDPYGAVILVSVAIADIAYKNGINPVHFWMVVLVAFELGYLSPPVALNHLLTRLVVGAPEPGAEPPSDASFFRRHERILLPVLVMGTALLLVAFVPLWFYSS